MKKSMFFYAFFYLVLVTNSHYIWSNNLIVESNKALAAPILRYDPSGSNAWYPYYIDEIDKPGILPDVINEILSIAEIKGIKRTFPPMRTIYALKRGDIDFDLVNLDWFSENKQAEGFVYSDGLIRIKEYVVSLQSTPHHIEGTLPEDIGTVRGYYYHNDKEFNRIDFTSERELIMALKLNRVKAIICGDRPALYWSKLLNVPIELRELHSDGYLRIRLRSALSHLLPKLNDAIDQLNSNGKLDKIIKRYISEKNTEIP